MIYFVVTGVLAIWIIEKYQVISCLKTFVVNFQFERKDSDFIGRTK